MELPSEPGYYLDKEGDAWVLQENGKLKNLDAYRTGDAMSSEAGAQMWAPFTRLESRADTAKAVLTRLAEIDSTNIIGGRTCSAIRETIKVLESEFGVTDA